MKSTGKILIIDDDDDILTSATLLLKRHYETVRGERDPKKIPDILAKESFDVILLDMNFDSKLNEGGEGFHWLGEIKKITPSTVVVLITAYGNVEKAVKAIKQGASDFVLKPWQNEKLLATVSASLELRNSREVIKKLKEKQKDLSSELNKNFGEFIGKSPAMLALFDTINKVSGTDANILILGENGTGKELAARAIHRQSLRADKQFISVDLGALSETLFESELFGHVRGSFTDAKEDRTGRFETASGGTLFLDEIGNLSLQLQKKLLTVLQNSKITRLGSNTPVQIDVRFIFATNMQLYKMIEEKKFRQDLLYRINTIELYIPPLRERLQDLPLLSEYFLSIYTKKYHKGEKTIAPETYKHLEKHNWPGNIRELQHSIERAIIMSESDVLRPDDFFFISSKPHSKSEVKDTASLNIGDSEKLLIQKALQRNWGNITAAAKELGLSRAALYRRIEKYGL